MMHRQKNIKLQNIT